MMTMTKINEGSPTVFGLGYQRESILGSRITNCRYCKLANFAPTKIGEEEDMENRPTKKNYAGNAGAFSVENSMRKYPNA